MIAKTVNTKNFLKFKETIKTCKWHVAFDYDFENILGSSDNYKQLESEMEKQDQSYCILEKDVIEEFLDDSKIHLNHFRE
jgi:hypothetical protein